MWEKRIEELKKQIKDIRDQWPPHSPPPGLLERLDDLEAELEGLLSECSEVELDG